MERKETDKQVIQRCFRVLRKSPEGEELFHALISHCGFGRGVFSPESPHQTAYNAGRQSVANMLNGMDEDTDPKKNTV
jgi:hypothetical protein